MKINCKRCGTFKEAFVPKKTTASIEICVECWEKTKKSIEPHEHRYYPNSRQKSDTCLICGYKPNWKNEI